MPDQWNEGDRVVICGRRTTLVRPLSDIPGGWVVEPPVLNMRFWNEGEMKPVRAKN